MGTVIEDVNIGKVEDIVNSNEESNINDSIVHQRPPLIRNRRSDLNINSTTSSQEKHPQSQKSKQTIFSWK